MNKTYKSLLSYLSVALLIFLLPLSLKAQTMDDLKNQFVALGGSEDGFNKIIQVVQKSQDASNQLKSKIEQTYNKQMFDIMVAPNFDPNAYTQAYNQLEQDKADLVKQNLQDMISLLQSLSPKDRQAYAQLLYGVNNTVPALPTNNEQNKDSNSTPAAPTTNNSNAAPSDANTANAISDKSNNNATTEDNKQ